MVIEAESTTGYELMPAPSTAQKRHQELAKCSTAAVLSLCIVLATLISSSLLTTKITTAATIQETVTWPTQDGALSIP